ncbi:hypothetical protein CC78DRAFT_379457 [Lojkania enalia]|uniref:Frequency clock protein n=1 Tax=Lojkania enalia TaxID=147567 RepID=A0A9P4KJI6_9PLEO|nr:hypothetical protein CC78DRAFT_379457 [Didymosphaeria enalia]
MNDPTSTVGHHARRTAHHPRRPPAHKSVSLRHSPPAALSSKPLKVHAGATSLSSPNAPASDKANPPSTVSSNLIVNKHSSGESSDAGKWFENTNNAVQSNTSFVDNDPPFFLRNSSSSGTPPEGLDTRLHLQSATMPYRSAGMTQLGTDGSSTEDFRSVIDDLTIANKKLRQRLRKYEKLHDEHLQDEKLFEVRFHGLPDHKKRELEETLQKFAASLDDTGITDYPGTALAAPLNTHKTLSSSTSRFAESGYASMSTSGQNSSTAPSAPSGQDSDRRKMSRSQYNRQQQNVHSYLHDIPGILLPRQGAPMTDKAKKKLVVRRLEQIFAGKTSAPGNHAQPIQQEEVAQSAAMADRRAKEESGQHYQREGHREARIMQLRSAEDYSGKDPVEALQRTRPSLAVTEQDFVPGSKSPDQRPTRPLDLDPYRAQVPAENMEYIRHLGFTPPDMASGDAPQDGHGWLYLNLLINMAQLHTINVTPDFVKDAVTEHSSRLELSHDGRKVRWKGGLDVTKGSSGSSSEHLSGSSPYDVDPSSGSKSPVKRIKTGHSGESGASSIDPERQARRSARAIKEREQNKFTYNPIFYHKDDSDDDDDYYNLDMISSNNSFPQAQNRGDSSGFGSSAMRSSSSRKRRDDGPMIFYSKAKFCTDLSGDRHGASIAHPSSYKSFATQPLGAPQLVPSELRSIEGRQPGDLMDVSLIDLDSKQGECTTSSEEELGFSLDALRNDISEDSPDNIEFEVSGLGGVQPDDNFAIRVKRSQVRTQRLAQEAARHKTKQSQLYPQTILDALKEQTSSDDEHTTQPTMIKERIVSAARKDLPSSALPPPSFLPFDSTSSGDVDSDLDSDVSSGPSDSSSSQHAPASGLQLLNISPTGER